MTRSPLGLQGFYEEVAYPLLTTVEVEYPENAILDLTRNTYQHFYDGSEIVVAGRLVDEDMNNFKADVKGHGVSLAWIWAGDGGSSTDGACAYRLTVQQWQPPNWGHLASGLHSLRLSPSPTPAPGAH